MRQTETSDPVSGPTSGHALAVAAAGTLLTLVAFTAPLATLNGTAAGLGTGMAGRTWILSSMSIGLGAALLSTGTVSDDFGRRRTFVAGSLLLALASLLAAVSPDVVTFVLMRVLQGVGGAAVIASSLGIIAASFPAGPLRAHASGVWGASLGAGIATGPLLSAGLERLHSWRDVYGVLCVAALAVAAAAHRGVVESRAEHRKQLDVVGVLLLAAGMSALLAALVEGRQSWTSPVFVALGAASVLLLAGFVALESRSDHAMLDLALFRQPAFVAATVGALATGAGVISLTSYLSAFAGLALHISSLAAATLLLLWSGVSVVTALLARRIPVRVPGRVQLAIGLLGVGIGQLAMFGVGTDSTWVRFVPGLFVAGLSSGVLNAALGREAVASVPPGRAGLGSGANNTARYVGSAIGVTVVSVVAAGSTAGELVDGWNRAVLVTAGVSVLGAVVVLASRARPPRP
jgi:MFS family permease